MAVLINERTQSPVADFVEVADTRRARRRGLLGRDTLDEQAALVLSSCAAVHTAFMRFPIDVAFVDRNGCVVQMAHGLQPWRIALSLRARAVIELAAGRLKGMDVAIGDRLYLTPSTDEATAIPEAASPAAAAASDAVTGRSTRAAATALVLLLAGSWLWLWNSSHPAVQASTIAETDSERTIPTGASFSFRVSSLSSEEYARSIAASIESLDLPVVVRDAPDGLWHEVFVGPYVATDEADAAQRTLVSSGFGGARLLVDESLRASSGVEPVVERPTGAGPLMSPVVLVPGPGRLSLVVETGLEPQQVFAQRVSSSSLEVEIGPVTERMRSQEWDVPAGISLLSRVAIAPVARPDGSRVIRATVTLPLTAHTKVRLSSRRVYIDVFWAPVEHAVPQDVAPMMGARRPIAAVRGAVPAPSRAADAPLDRATNQYETGMQAAISRFEEIRPFLMAATASPSPDVLRAVGQTLSDLDGVIRSLQPPSTSNTAYALLESALKAAALAVGPSFTGDRAIEAQRAFAQVQKAKEELGFRSRI